MTPGKILFDVPPLKISRPLHRGQDSIIMSGFVICGTVFAVTFPQVEDDTQAVQSNAIAAFALRVYVNVNEKI